MGISTDGVLFYGIALGEYITEHLIDPEIDIDDGFEEGYNDYGDSWLEASLKKITGITENMDYNEEQELRKKLGVFNDIHCSYDYPMHFIYTVKHTARRGHPITIENFDPPPNSMEKLKKACELLGLKFDESKVGWHLCSLWG